VKQDTPAKPHEANLFVNNLFVKRWGVEAVNLDFAGGQQGAMLQVHGGIEQSPHFLRTQGGGEFAPILGLGYFLVEPRAV
jgi:hypothetical protein